MECTVEEEPVKLSRLFPLYSSASVYLTSQKVLEVAQLLSASYKKYSEMLTSTVKAPSAAGVIVYVGDSPLTMLVPSLPTIILLPVVAGLLSRASSSMSTVAMEPRIRVVGPSYASYVPETPTDTVRFLTLASWLVPIKSAYTLKLTSSVPSTLDAAIGLPWESTQATSMSMS